MVKIFAAIGAWSPITKRVQGGKYGKEIAAFSHMGFLVRAADESLWTLELSRRGVVSRLLKDVPAHLIMEIPEVDHRGVNRYLIGHTEDKYRPWRTCAQYVGQGLLAGGWQPPTEDRFTPAAFVNWYGRPEDIQWVHRYLWYYDLYGMP